MAGAPRVAWLSGRYSPRTTPRKPAAYSHGFSRRSLGIHVQITITPLVAYLTRLRFPALFAITGVFFILDFFIPDVLPFVDEILLGLGAALLGSWKKRKEPNPPNDPSGR
jgi:hypothetical protein